jgi:hypothetical protein
VFDPADVSSIAEEVGRSSLARTRAGARHVLAIPAVRDMANDQRLLDLAARGLGSAPIPFRATLFDKSPASNWLVAWHQDTALPLRNRVDDSAWGPWSTKAGVLYAHAPAFVLEQIVALRVSVDDSTPLNGPLRVLPGSHDRGVLTEAEIADVVRAIAPAECTVDAGGVIAMRPLTVHASSKSRSDRPRRVLHIEYAARLDIAPGVTLAVS